MNKYRTPRYVYFCFFCLTEHVDFFNTYIGMGMFLISEHGQHIVFVVIIDIIESWLNN